jgi:hypothetical protein
MIYQDRLGTNTQPQFQGDPCCTGVEAFDLVYDSFAKQLGENQLTYSKLNATTIFRIHESLKSSTTYFTQTR